MSKTQRLFLRLAKRQVKIKKLNRWGSEPVWTVKREGSVVTTWARSAEQAKQEQQEEVKRGVTQLRAALRTLERAGLQVFVKAI